MFPSLKYFWLALILMLSGTQSMFGFALLGPFNEPYQIPEIGYHIQGDIGAPKNKGEEYRWNTRTVFYAYDENFLDYFGSNGVAAVDQAIGIMNALTNLSSYSSDLSEIPQRAARFNSTALSLSLLDLKTSALHALMEQLGLAEPERYVWTLHNRFLTPQGTCPLDETYTVIKRNFDPVTTDYSSYVNGVLYSYFIVEICTGPDPLAQTVGFPVDPTEPGLTAVAGRNFGEGIYYTGLTRDDVGGLRYLMGTNRLHVESVEPTSQLIVTNNNSELLVTSDLALFSGQAFSNNAVDLQLLYPGLIILNTTNVFVNAVTTNFSAYFTNFPFSPAGSQASLVITTNYTTNAVTRFIHTFGNLVTNTAFATGNSTLLTTTTAVPPFSPAGTLPQTKVTPTTLITGLNGDFFILPTNACDVQILSLFNTTVISTTNLLVTATNAPGVTNVNGQAFSQSVVTYFTNHTYIVKLVFCQPNTVALRQGIDKMTFVRKDFDSLLGQFFTPFTNIYNLTAVTNNAVVTQAFRRVVTQPDIVFSAEDLIPAPGGPFVFFTFLRNVNFNQANILPFLAGPGTIEPRVRFSFNKVGPIYLNAGVFFLKNEGSQSLNFQWGSFDGTTNAPIVYPAGTSLANLENQIIMQVTSGVLPNGTVGAGYSTTLQVTGGQPTYSWSLAPNSPGLPDGLSLSADGVISGTPTTTGIFDFIVQVTDAGARVTQRDLTIEIDP